MKPSAVLVLVMTLASFVLLPRAGAARAAAWQRPVQGPVVRSFALAADRFARGQHRGIDIAARPGSTVRAACAGRVTFAGRVPGGGGTVSVGCGHRIATYQHVRALLVARGQALAAGAAIGTVGSDLYLSAREMASGRHIDPQLLFGHAPRARSPQRHAPPAGFPVPVLVTPRSSPLAVRAPAIPLAAWIGLVACGLGLPLGGLVTRSEGARARIDSLLRRCPSTSPRRSIT